MDKSNSKRKSRKANNSTGKKSKSPIFKMKSQDIPTDILGSYTGSPLNPFDSTPVQDADDL